MTGEDDARLALLALEAGGMASWRLDPETAMVTGDDRLAALYGFEAGHWPIPLTAMAACMHPGDAPRVTAAMTASLEDAEGGTGYDQSFRVRRTPGAEPGDPGAWRWLRGRGRPVRAEGDAPAALVGLFWDVSDARRAAEGSALVAAEMDHRVKNAFAIMRALVNIGRRRATDLASFADDLGAQVQAMADAHEIAARLALSGGDPRPVVPTAEVIETALAPWIAAHPDQVTVSLDRRLALPASRVSALSMLIQELAANAAKHGALRRPDANRQGANGQDAAGQDGDGGKLTVTVERTRRDGALFARLVWNETVAAPLRPGEADRPTSGFGDVLIEHCLASLEAAEERELRPEGLKLAVVLPLPGTKASAAQ